MTSVIMNMRRSRDFGQHPELEEVLNQIISVFSTDDEQHEELVAIMASDEQYVARTGYRPKRKFTIGPESQQSAKFGTVTVPRDSAGTVPRDSAVRAGYPVPVILRAVLVVLYMQKEH